MRTSSVRIPVVTLAVLAAVTLLAPPAAAVQYYFVVDVPTTLGGATYSQNQVARRNAGGGYTLAADFPPEVPLAGLVRTPEGLWLLSPAAVIPLDVGALEPRDLIRGGR